MFTRINHETINGDSYDIELDETSIIVYMPNASLRFEITHAEGYKNSTIAIYHDEQGKADRVIWERMP